MFGWHARAMNSTCVAFVTGPSLLFSLLTRSSRLMPLRSATSFSASLNSAKPILRAPLVFTYMHSRCDSFAFEIERMTDSL